jgi:hypothetical protein
MIRLSLIYQFKSLTVLYCQITGLTQPHLCAGRNQGPCTWIPDQLYIHVYIDNKIHYKVKRRITHLSDTDISFTLFNISSKFLLYLECYLLSPKMHFCQILSVIGTPHLGPPS